MNREMRRLVEREERLNKKKTGAAATGGRRAARQANSPGAAARRPATERKSIVVRITQFFKEVRVELRRVSWPSRQQMIAFTAVTLITSIVLTVVVFGLDIGLKELVLFGVKRG